jgi:hypothetical protein
MASGLPLNTFKNIPLNIPTALTTVYTTPLGITTIVLMAQASNVISESAKVSFVHYSFRTGLSTFIVKEIDVPPNDARILLGGKLVLETGDQIKIQSDTSGALQFLASILETANQ